MITVIPNWIFATETTFSLLTFFVCIIIMYFTSKINSDVAIDVSRYNGSSKTSRACNSSQSLVRRALLSIFLYRYF